MEQCIVKVDKPSVVTCVAPKKWTNSSSCSKCESLVTSNNNCISMDIQEDCSGIYGKHLDSTCTNSDVYEKVPQLFKTSMIQGNINIYEGVWNEILFITK